MYTILSRRCGQPVIARSDFVRRFALTFLFAAMFATAAHAVVVRGRVIDSAR